MGLALPASLTDPRQVWRLVVQYDGRAFHGFQRQPNGITVQSSLEDSLSTLFDERIIIHGSGRTDAGVHALGQVVSFRSAAERVPYRVRMGLNTMLPRELSVVECALAPSQFHARFSASGKTYRYRILNRRDRCPFHEGFAMHVRYPLDWAAIELGLSSLVGTHDYSTFRGAGCNTKTSIRTIDRAVHLGLGDEHHLEFHGNGFLRYQVRKMVGTLVEVGAGKRAAADVALALAARDPARAGKTAYPTGLFLVSVDYPAEALFDWVATSGSEAAD